MQQKLVIQPDVQEEGAHAMNLGYLMRTRSVQQGFTFCHYKHGTAERANFLVGCCISVFGSCTEKITI